MVVRTLHDDRLEIYKAIAPCLFARISGDSSGSRKRPELAKALAHARNAKAAFVVAKLDRLARNVAFVSQVHGQRSRFHRCG